MYYGVVGQVGMAGFYHETNGPRSGLGVNSGDNDCDGERFGNAVLTENSWNAPYQAWSLSKSTPPGSEWRKLLCMQTVFLHTVRPCVTHTVFSPESLTDTQISEVRDHVNPIALTAWATVVGGDFNETPLETSLDRMYSNTFQSGYGLFSEASQNCQGSLAQRCGLATLGSLKVDYMFLGGLWRSPVASTGTASVSDHKVFRATVLLKAYR